MDGANNQIIINVKSVLEQEAKFPFLVRNKIDEMATNDIFLHGVEEAVHDLLIDNAANNYTGLDRDRDTEEEVEFAIRCFPGVLSRGIETNIGSKYPIALQLYFNHGGDVFRCNIKAVSFIPLLARLGIELGQFEINERGGLLAEVEEGDNVLHFLVSTSDDSHDAEHHQLVDDRFLGVLRRLRETNLLKKEDIQEHNLVPGLCQYDYFAKKRFQYLTEWDPNSLTYADDDSDGKLPLHHVAYSTSIGGFRVVFKAGIHYFPKKKGIGLLFRKDRDGDTPFQLACEEHGIEEAMKVIESALADCSPDKPYSTAHALVSATIDEKIDLDGVYFLLRREPDVLQTLLLSARQSDNDGSENNGDSDDDGSLTSTTDKTRKRKQR